MLVYKLLVLPLLFLLRAGFWINVIQPSMVQHVQLVTFLELFLCKVGVNLPVRVGNKWMQFDNSNAGTLLGRSLGAQIQVLEWLVRGVFDNHLGCALGVFQIAKPESAIFQPLKAISIPWSNRIVQRRTATMVQTPLTTMGRPFGFARDLARAFP